MFRAIGQAVCCRSGSTVENAGTDGGVDLPVSVQLTNVSSSTVPAKRPAEASTVEQSAQAAAFAAHRGQSDATSSASATTSGDMSLAHLEGTRPELRGLPSFDLGYRLMRNYETDIGYELLTYIDPHFSVKGVLNVRDFHQFSSDLKTLHQRGYYHGQISVTQVAISDLLEGKRGLYTMCPDQISNIPKAHPCANFGAINEATPAADGKAADEHGLLLLLLSVADCAAVEYGHHFMNLTEVQRSRFRTFATNFVKKYVQKDHRLQVLEFICTPSRNTYLKPPIHDLINWSAPPDLISAMLTGNAVAIRENGEYIKAPGMSSRDRIRFLRATSGNGEDGILGLMRIPDQLRYENGVKAWQSVAQKLNIWDQVTAQRDLNKRGRYDSSEMGYKLKSDFTPVHQEYFGGWELHGRNQQIGDI